MIPTFTFRHVCDVAALCVLIPLTIRYAIKTIRGR